MTTFLVRYIIIQTIGGAGLVTLWASGTLATFFVGESMYAGIIIGACVLAGLALVLHSQWQEANQVADYLPAAGLLGCAIGFKFAFDNFASMSGGDTQVMLQVVAGGMGLALTSTIAGILGMLWLKLNLRLLRPPHGVTLTTSED